MKYKAVIFDLFGTLVDAEDLPGYASALRETSSLLKLKHEDFFKVWKETTEKRATGGFKTLEESLAHICRELNAPVNNFDIRLAKMVRYDYISLLLTPRRYTIETLAELKREGYKMGLVSNCSMEIPDVWPRTPFAPFFELTLFSCTCGIQKPDPRVFQMAAEGLGIKPEECLYVDNNCDYLKIAAQSGMLAVLITGEEDREPGHPPEPVKQEWSGARIAVLPEVLDILEEAK